MTIEPIFCRVQSLWSLYTMTTQFTEQLYYVLWLWRTLSAVYNQFAVVYNEHAICCATLLCVMTLQPTFCCVQSPWSYIQWLRNSLCNFSVYNDYKADFLLCIISMDLYTMTIYNDFAIRSATLLFIMTREIYCCRQFFAVYYSKKSAPQWLST